MVTKYNELREEVAKDWQWADLYLPEAKSILKQVAGILVEFDPAPPDKDLKEVGDIVLRSNMGDIGFRVRRPDVKYRDLTIRSRRKSGTETELAKIQKGFCRWYLYAWADGDTPRGNGRFKDWVLVDMDQFRACGLAYQYRPERDNRDGTWFVAYKVTELEYHQCTVAMHNNLLDHPEETSLYTIASQIAQEALQNELVNQEYNYD